MMPRQITEPSEFELAVAARLGLDPDTVLMGSIRLEYDGGDEHGVVRWTGAARIPAADALELLAIARRERRTR